MTILAAAMLINMARLSNNETKEDRTKKMDPVFLFSSFEDYEVTELTLSATRAIPRENRGVR